MKVYGIGRSYKEKIENLATKNVIIAFVDFVQYRIEEETRILSRLSSLNRDRLCHAYSNEKFEGRISNWNLKQNLR